MAEVTTAYAPGTPCWVDLMARDQQAALDFYRDLLGWHGQAGPAEFGGYALCELDGKAAAGIGPAMATEGTPVPPPIWTTYLASDDAEATEHAIIAAGGSVIAPVMDVGTLGRMLIASDPGGAAFGVWQARDFPGARVVNQAGALVWNELHASDIPAAAAFYGEVFGIDIEPAEGADSYWELKVGGRPAGGARLLADDPPGTLAQWLPYFATDNVDSAVGTTARHHGTVLLAPFDMMAGRMAVVADPQGATFALINPSPA
jgi:uncharacterized protein